MGLLLYRLAQYNSEVKAEPLKDDIQEFLLTNQLSSRYAV